jgi:lysophospholipase L1-like esterase
MKPLRFLGACVTWALLVLVSVEVLSFLIITASNYLLYHQVREGLPAIYDPYTLFLRPGGPRPTLHNAGAPAGAKHRVIWLFGGSTLRGATDHDDRTIPSYLAGILNQAGSPTAYTLVNFGVDSFNSLLETKYFQKELIENPQGPDLVIFYDGANDSTYFSQYLTPEAHLGYRRLRALVEGYHQGFLGLLKPLNAAWYASFTKELSDKFRLAMVPLSPDAKVLRENVTATLQRYRHVRKVAGCYGAGFLLFWQPYLWMETGQVAPPVKRREEKDAIILGRRFKTMRHNFSVTYLALKDRLQQEPYFVDFQNVLCPRTQPVYQPDGVHLTDAGRLMVARAMSRVLKARGFGVPAPGGARPVPGDR